MGISRKLKVALSLLLTSTQQRTVSSQELRFSKKIAFDAADQQELQTQIDAAFPLGPEDFPLTLELCEILQHSNCPSIVMPDDYGVKYNVTELIEVAGGFPTHAPQREYWAELEEVIDYQLRRRWRRGRNKAMSPNGMPWLNLPDLWRDLTVAQVAEAVHDEYPGYHQARLIGSLLKQGMQPDNNIIPRRCKRQFLHGVVLYSHLNTWAVDMVGPHSFATKYYVGRARPEEGVLAVFCSMDGNHVNPMCEGVPLIRPQSLVPSVIRQKVRRLRLTNRMEAATAYPEGSPMHPSWPAMHSAASCLSLWLPVVANLTPEQIEETKKMDLAVAMARTVAGVHYKTDNIAGLRIGQEVIARALPTYLQEKYGSDPEVVAAKIASLRFDWGEEMERLLSENGATPQ